MASTTKQFYAERDAEIVRRHGEGEEPGALGRAYDLTRVRILQIIRQAHPPESWQIRARRHRAQAVEATRRWDAGLTYAQVAEAMGISRWQAQSMCWHLRYERSQASGDHFWASAFADSQRLVMRDLLLGALEQRDWDAVREALDVVYQGVREAYDAPLKRGWSASEQGAPDAIDA